MMQALTKKPSVSTQSCAARMASLAVSWAGPLGGALILSACAGLPAARIALPAELAAGDPLVLQMPVGVAAGEFRLGAFQGRFERHASRLEWAGRLAQDRAVVSYTLQPTHVRADCKLIGNTATLGIVTLPLKRADYACHFSRDGQALAQRLELQAVDAAAGTRTERRGRLVADGVTLELQSLHHLEGGRWPQSTPVGYLIHHQGVPVAALDLNDTRPRLWHRAADDAVASAVVQAALALALLWDPAAH